MDFVLLGMASINASNESNATRGARVLLLVKYGLVAVGVTCVVNLAVLFGSLAAIDPPPEFVGGPFGPLALGPVIVNSGIAAVGATIVYGVVGRYARRPNRTFGIVAGVALVLSFAMFLAPDIAGAPLTVFAVLGVMHVAAAVVIVGVLTRATELEAAYR